MKPSLLQPLRFQPHYRPMIWGGRKLSRFLGKNLPTTDAYGESWEVSDHRLHPSRLATASGFGVSLRQLMEHQRPELLGPAAERHAVFPWLIKLLDAQDTLSVQVHPDDEAVKTLWPGEAAKTEAWLILDAAPTSRIYAGLKPGVGASELRSALAKGAVMECLHAFTPRVGDCVFLPAGTVHALGGGILLAEIQQTSDATFRLYDWDRRDAKGQLRPLHVEQALAAIHWDLGPVQPIATSDSRSPLVTCPYFQLERIRAEAPLHLGGIGKLQALIVAEGEGRFANGEFCVAGDVWVLPAQMPRTELNVERPVAGLLCTLP